MTITPLLIIEIQKHLEHGDIQSIAKQLGLDRSKVKNQLSNIGMKNYDANIFSAAITRIEARGVSILHKPVTA